ncbi:hypothetical protein [Schlesneria paludicola]|uniref:hypothetical protein n=1 Tax=Schlesneria paludicola TaxID=360056 RepID=UPI0002FB83A1|nr:hypothetical protein [Schlesneria paludicola]
MSDSTSSTAPAAIAPAVLSDNNRTEAGSRERRSSSMRLSFLGLVLAVVGLGLAVIPSLATERVLPNPFESKEEAKRRIDGPPAKAGGITVRVKNFSINFFGKDVKEPAPAQPPLAFTNDPVRWLMIVGCVLALVSLVIASVAHRQERHGFMTFTAMSCSVVALTWQFLVFGIMLGVAAAILFLLIAALNR